MPWTGSTSGIRRRPLWSDEKTNRNAQIIEFLPGSGMPLHRHVGFELMYVIEGSLTDQFGTLRPGNISYRPNGCVHAATSPNGAIVLAVISGGNEPAEEIGDSPQPEFYVPEDQAWIEAPSGIRSKQIVADENANWTVGIRRYPEGVAAPRHRHDGDELLFVIEGESMDDSGTTTPGNMSYMPHGTEHTFETRTGATVLTVEWGRKEPLPA
jgi:anti-sigma factor ChrR (cupin superfamily)